MALMDILRHRSAPTPSTEDALKEMTPAVAPSDGSVNGMTALQQPIGEKQIAEAYSILQSYKTGKANLENRVVENEMWFKMRHWDVLPHKENQVQPSSGWLFNAIANKHADAMDNFPSPNVLPREEGDKAEAEMLSSIIPVILEQNEFEDVYSDVWMYKLKSGTGIYGVFWDGKKLNGLGDVAIKKIDLLNVFWESGVTNIQDSRNLFTVELVDNDVLMGMYPQTKNRLSTPTVEVSRYIYDDTVDTTNKSAVVDWYYKRMNSQGKTVLHYCKFVNNIVLYSSENDPAYRERGYYDHGKYPFIFDPLYRVEGTPAGFGFIDVGKDAQEYIDRGNQAILQNMLSNARPRHFIRSDGAVKEEEYADMTKDFVHVDGNLGQDSILPIQGKPLSEIYVNVINNKIDELKETTGNRDISTGGTASGVTAASAIAAMQEAGSKLSRDMIKGSYRAFRDIVLMVIELIRQFYDLPRCFRIMGNNGTARFVQYSNAGIAPKDQGVDFGIDMGVRIPLFDIEVTAQKASPYSKMSQNELALQFYQAGFFNPANADQALMCLDMMDFNRKQELMNKIQENGGMLRQMMMMAQMLDGGNGPISQGLSAQFGLPMQSAAEGSSESPSENVDNTEALGGSTKDEAENTRKARQRTADMTAPS